MVRALRRTLTRPPGRPPHSNTGWMSPSRLLARFPALGQFADSAMISWATAMDTLASAVIRSASFSAPCSAAAAGLGDSVDQAVAVAVCGEEEVAGQRVLDGHPRGDRRGSGTGAPPAARDEAPFDLGDAETPCSPRGPPGRRRAPARGRPRVRSPRPAARSAALAAALRSGRPGLGWAAGRHRPAEETPRGRCACEELPGPERRGWLMDSLFAPVEVVQGRAQCLW